MQLSDHCARVAADERISTEVLAAFDGFEKKCFSWSANFAIGGERSFDIREQAPGYGDKIPPLGESEEID
jgi:hypothetical protein